MTKQRKQFSPHIYPEWGELFDAISAEERSEILLGITKYPEYEPKNVPIWNFIKSQLNKDYEIFIDKCNKNGEISRNYWKNKNTNDTERLPNDIERYPKRITNNELRITNNDITNNKQKKKKIDAYASKEVDEFIKVYQQYNKSSRILNQTRLKIAQAIEVNGLDVMLEVIKKSANKGHLINSEFIPLSVGNMLDNAQKILDDNYNLVDRQNKKLDIENMTNEDAEKLIFG